MKKVAVVDGQGGGIGKTIIDKLKKEFENDIEIIALGTNTYATANMVKQGANQGVSGESAICYCCRKIDFDCIIGPIGIVIPNSMNKEITPSIAESVFNSKCIKYLIPLRKHGIYIPGTSDMQIKDFIEDIIRQIKE